MAEAVDADADGSPAGLQPVADGTVTAGGAAAVSAVGVRHVFGNSHVALDSVDVSAREGEFCTLLGPSGSGKTTLLRILAGLVSPTSGRVFIGRSDVTDVPVQRRNIGFVFQHYALFPHLTVAENLAFPLRVRGIKGASQRTKVRDALDLVQLRGLEDRRPGELSGGQQQRVAVARALVFGPEVLLLDEPLGALDRRLRQQLGGELRRIQRAAGTTAIYVTHDQEEAFLLSDTVVVMNHGRIHQAGSPPEVYGSPADLFVATFLGDTNVLNGRLSQITPAGAVLAVDGLEVECSGPLPDGSRIGDQFSCSIRPEDLEVYDGDAPAGRFVLGKASVDQIVFMGSRFRLSLRLNDNTLLAEVTRGPALPQIGQTLSVGWPKGVPVAIRRD